MQSHLRFRAVFWQSLSKRYQQSFLKNVNPAKILIEILMFQCVNNIYKCTKKLSERFEVSFNIFFQLYCQNEITKSRKFTFVLKITFQIIMAQVTNFLFCVCCFCIRFQLQKTTCWIIYKFLFIVESDFDALENKLKQHFSVSLEMDNLIYNFSRFLDSRSSNQRTYFFSNWNFLFSLQLLLRFFQKKELGSQQRKTLRFE